MRETVTVTGLANGALLIKVSDNAGHGTRYLAVHTSDGWRQLVRALAPHLGLDPALADGPGPTP
jgi:hypothetical protein